MTRLITTIFLVLAAGGSAADAFELRLLAEAGGGQFRSQTAPTYSLTTDSFDVLRDGLPSAATATMRSQTGRFTLRSEGGNNFFARNSTQQLLTEVNGTWRITINDQGTIYEYDANLLLSLPFDELPYFTSSRLVPGNEVGPFDWQLQGGSVDYPGENALVEVQLYQGVFAQRVAVDYLPLSDGAWNPLADFSAADMFIGSVATVGEAIDETGFQVQSITPVTPGAPELSFGQLHIAYTAALNADLVGVTAIPEPGAIALFATALVAAGIACRSRRPASALSFCAVWAALGVCMPAESQGSIVQIQLTGSVSSITAEDLDGNDDSIAFQSLLPFAVGTPVQAAIRYDASTGLRISQTFVDVAGTVQLTIGDSVFFDEAVELFVSLDGGLFVRPEWGIANEMLPQGWAHEFLYGVQGESAGDHFVGFNAVSLFGINSQSGGDGSVGLPLHPGTYVSTTFEIFTGTNAQDGASTWTVPISGSHAGRHQSIFGQFDRLTWTVVPEPASVMLAAAVTVLGLSLRRTRCGRQVQATQPSCAGETGIVR